MKFEAKVVPPIGGSSIKMGQVVEMYRSGSPSLTLTRRGIHFPYSYLCKYFTPVDAEAKAWLSEVGLGGHP